MVTSDLGLEGLVESLLDREGKVFQNSVQEILEAGKFR